MCCLYNKQWICWLDSSKSLPVDSWFQVYPSTHILRVEPMRKEFLSSKIFSLISRIVMMLHSMGIWTVISSLMILSFLHCSLFILLFKTNKSKRKYFDSFQLYAQVLLTGQRTNVDFVNNRPIPSSSLYHSYIQYLARIGNLFTGLALVSSICLALMNRIILSFPKAVSLPKGSLISLLVGSDMIITLVTLSITTVKTMIGLISQIQVLWDYSSSLFASSSHSSNGF